MNIINEIKASFKKGDYLVKLIYINVAVFLIVNIVNVVSALFALNISGALLDWMAMPAYLPQLAWRVWTPITYMFLHEGFMHLLFNMLWLFWMGRIFVEYLGPHKLLSVYLVGGLAGAGLYVLAFNVLPVFHPSVFETGLILGASGAVMAVVMGIAAYLPDYTIHLMFIGPVRLKYVALAMIVLDVIGIAGSNAGGHIAHIGGAALGAIWGYRLGQGTDLLKPVHPLLFSLTKLFTPKPVIRVHYRTDERFGHLRAEPRTPSQKEMDPILDKIAKSGYDSLTKDEKNILFRMSNRPEA